MLILVNFYQFSIFINTINRHKIFFNILFKFFFISLLSISNNINNIIR